ncbi:hypothetical protein [Tropicibacter naphthalenivorans]|nr:hypothetical protein [Tropicibacter naphthalenivorans]
MFSPVQAREAQDIWHQSAPVSSRLGLAFPNDRTEDYPAIAAMGIGVVRVAASWGRIGRAPYDFSGLDYRIGALGALGIAPFITFESNHRTLADHTGQVKNGTPRDMALWAGFVRAVVERYDGDGFDDMPGLQAPVAYVQAGNEFLRADNRSGGWAGTDEGLVAYLNATHDAAKIAAPEVPFVLGGLAAVNIDLALLAEGGTFTIRQEYPDRTFTMTSEDVPGQKATLQRLDTVLTKARFDLVDAHLYGPVERDAARLGYLTDRTNRPALSSECGGPTTDYGEAYTGHRHFAAVLERNLAVLAAGGRVCLWFGLNERLKTSFSNRQTPLYTADMTPKPGVDAYRLLASFLSDGGAVETIGPRQYTIQTTQGPICIAFGQDAQAIPLTDCYESQNAVCVLDAQTRTAQLVPVATLPHACGGDAISLTGPGLSPILKRNRQQ